MRTVAAFSFALIQICLVTPAFCVEEWGGEGTAESPFLT
jgi:hypothetical protein